MNKACRFAIPLILACALLGLAIYLSSASSRALASSDSLATASEYQPALKPTMPGSNLLVTTLDDELINDGNCSLREAIQAANTNSEVDDCGSGDVLTDTITFNVEGTIMLIDQLAINNAGLLMIDGGGAITLNGNNNSRIFYINFDAQLGLHGLALINGYTGGQGGAIINLGTLDIRDSAISDSRSLATGGGIHNLQTLFVENCTISNNTAGEDYYFSGYGGGIYNALYATLVMTDSTVSGNSLIGGNSDGGGIGNSGSLIINHSTVSGNDAQRLGGGINSDYGNVQIIDSELSGNQVFQYGGGLTNNYGTMEIVNSLITGNTSTWNGGAGGGIINGDSMTITNSTVSGNHAANGGGLFNGGTAIGGKLLINKSTFSGNNADSYGGGLYNDAKLTITNSTLSGNFASTSGGGITNGSLLTVTLTTLAFNGATIEGGGFYRQPGSLQALVSDSIISNSVSGGNCANNPIIDDGHNIEDTDTCGLDPLNGSLPDTDPLLGPLQDNGGPTLTHALLPGSPAIDAGDNDQCPPTDQRGVPRPQDGNGDGLAVCDIGSYELEPGQLVVTTLNDIVDSDDGYCSLREAIQAANTNLYVEDCGSGIVLTDTITFDVVGTIVVNSQLEVTDGGPLVIDGGQGVATSGGAITRIFYINTGAVVNLHSITMENGYDFYGGGGIENHGKLFVDNSIIKENMAWGGAGIQNAGVLTVTNSLFTDNGGSYAGAGFWNAGTMTVISCTLSINSGGYGGAIGNANTLTIISSTISNNYGEFGGGIYNDGSLSIIDSLISDNIVSQQGGGIFNDDAAMLTVINSSVSDNSSNNLGGGIFNNYYDGVAEIISSTISGNSSDLVGGGIYNVGSMILKESTVSGNTVGYDSAESYGAGIHNGNTLLGGSLIVVNSTISGNIAIGNLGRGGGLTNWNSVTITNSTIYGNSAGNAGGIYIDYSAVVTITNSIIGNNLGGDCNNPLNDNGHNISSDDSCDFDPDNGSLPNTDPLLGPLQDNGGPTFTQALLPASPAIDAGDDAQCPSTDQRGFPRPIDGDGDGLAVCDIGSYEVQVPTVPPDIVIINGVSEGIFGPVIYFTATVEPVSTTLPLTYVWQASQHPPITHTTGLTDTAGWAWELPGTYAITVTASNPAGTVAGTHQISLSDVPISGLVASNDSPTTLGDATTFTATISQGTNVSYEWSFGDGSFGEGEILTHTYSSPGGYTATVTATNSANSTTAATQVTIIPGATSTYLPLVTRAGAPPRGGMPSSAPSAGLLACLGIMVALKSVIVRK